MEAIPVKDKEHKEITATDFAKIKNRTGAWGQWIAKKSIEIGNPYPRKVGHYWLATYDEWEEALQSLNIQMRRTKKQSRK